MAKKWTHEDLDQLISDQIPEGTNLEYKSGKLFQRGSKNTDDNARHKIREVVSAFANSSGGTLILGVSERNDLPVAIEPISSRLDYNRQWIERALGAITPAIFGVKIHPIYISKTEQVVYVIEVPEGETAHQADYKYYRRYNSENLLMVDREIRDVMNRNKAPRLAIHLGGNSWQISKDLIQVTFEITLNNIGAILVHHVKVYIMIPEERLDRRRISKLTSTSQYGGNYAIFDFKNVVRDVVKGGISGSLPHSQVYSPYRYEPILPGDKMIIGGIPIVSQEDGHKGRPIFAKLHCDNSEPQYFEYFPGVHYMKRIEALPK